MSLPPRTLAQLGHVALADAAALRVVVIAAPSPERACAAQEQREYLGEFAERLFAEAERLGFEGGADAAFGRGGGRRGGR